MRKKCLSTFVNSNRQMTFFFLENDSMILVDRSERIQTNGGQQRPQSRDGQRKQET